MEKPWAFPAPIQQIVSDGMITIFPELEEGRMVAVAAVNEVVGQLRKLKENQAMLRTLFRRRSR
jgi:hypothetical protein